MNYLFVPYEIALALKEKGFNKPCLAYYETKVTLNFLDTHFGSIIYTEKSGLGVDAPLYQQVIDWFDSKDIHIYTFKYGKGWHWKVDVGESNDTFDRHVGYKSRYEALTEAINHALTLLP